MRSGRLAVLEVNWEEQILKEEISLSVRPFLDGLEGAMTEDFLEGEFNSGEDFLEAISEFKASRARYLYVGSHGLKKQIIAPDHGINSQTIINQCRGSKDKGYFFSACDFVNPKTAREFLVKTKAVFIAGYSKSVPWLESILVDLFFLSYMLQGRVKRQLLAKRGGRGKRTSLSEKGDAFAYETSEKPMKVAQWVYEDLPLAVALGFDVYTLQRSQGKMPRLMSASRAWHRRKKVA
jgi:hypothetical protein